MDKVILSKQENQFFSELDEFLSKNLSKRFSSDAIFADLIARYLTGDNSMSEQIEELLVKDDVEVIDTFIDLQVKMFTNALRNFWYKRCGICE